MTTCWSGVFRCSPLGAAVFDVTPAHRSAVLDWAGAQDVAWVRRSPVHAPTVQAWAVLDGGITSLQGYGATTLSCGVRVVGFRALRLLLAELGLAGPVRPFDGETVCDPGQLRRHHREAPHDASALEQAEMLASCQDAVMLRWVAATLLAAASSAR